jgi:hypothetical protein
VGGFIDYLQGLSAIQRLRKAGGALQKVLAPMRATLILTVHLAEDV